MYSFKEIDGKQCVIHNKTQCTFPYHSKLSSYTKEELENNSYKDDLFSEWLGFSNSKRKKLKMAYNSGLTVQDIYKAKSALTINSISSNLMGYQYVSAPSLVPLKGEPCSCDLCDYLNDCNDYLEEEDTMMTEYNLVSEQTSYLKNRLLNIHAVKDTALERQFGLRDDDTPCTANELVARITSGKFVILADKGDDSSYSPTAFIRWRDPALKADRAGYDTAYKALQALYISARDQIVVKSPADGLTALQAFEAASVAATTAPTTTTAQ